MQRKAEAGAHALALELHGDEDQRRAVRPCPILRRPFQEAEAQIKDVGAAFLEGEPRGPVKIGEAPFKFGIGDVGVQVAPLHRVQDEILAPIFVLPVGQERRVATIAAVENGGLAEQLEPVAARELVLQRCRVRAFDRDGRFGIFEVEQPVSQR